MRDLKTIAALIILAIASLALIHYIYLPVSAADNLAVNETPTINFTITSTPTPTPTNIQIPARVLVTVTTQKVVPVMVNPAPTTNVTPTIYRVQQGDTVYLGDTIDISGVMAGVLNLAYYGGWDEESGDQFLIDTPSRKIGYYRFYIDPAIFTQRLGKWYKWNGYVERQANNLAFVVAEKRTRTNLSEEIELQNPNQTEVVIPRTPLLPVKHISDYLIAKGNGFSLEVNGSTSVWIFGYREGLYDYRAFNGSVDITPETINTLSPGKYTLLLMTQEPGYENIRTIRYNNETHMIDWFDPVGFGVNHFDTVGQTPESTLAFIQSIATGSHTTYKLFNLEIQPLSISIDRIDSLNALNATGDLRDGGVSLNEPGYIDVRGYTNAAPDTIIKVVVDPNFQMNEDMIWKDAIATGAQGELGGDMREFKVIVPVDKYNMGPGVHFVAAKTFLGDTYVTADFHIYENPAGNFIPNKTIRYISGKYGPEELIPTPTPITVTQIVTRVVTQIVTVPVTPSNEQVYAQQKIASEKTWWEGTTLLMKVIGSGVFLIGGLWYGIYVYRRAKE
jgi:hypothetical protein